MHFALNRADIYLVAMDTNSGAEYFKKKIPALVYLHLAFDYQQQKLIGIAFDTKARKTAFVKLGGLEDTQSTSIGVDTAPVSSL
mgnify:CR=1 FL=1